MQRPPLLKQLAFQRIATRRHITRQTPRLFLSIKIRVINHFGWNFPWVYLFPIMLVFNIPIVNFIRMYLSFMLGDFSMRIGKRRRVLINKQGRHP